MTDDVENDNTPKNAARTVGKFIHKFLHALGTLVGFLVVVGGAVVFTTGAGLAVGRFAEIVQGTISMRPVYDVWLDGWAIILGAYMLVWLPLSVLLRSVRERGS